MEDEVDTGRSYRAGAPVLVRVRRRGDRLTIDDGGAAVRLAGGPTGWHELVERIVVAEGLNVNRRGVVFVPAVREERQDRLVALVAATSQQVYEALLDRE